MKNATIMQWKMHNKPDYGRFSDGYGRSLDYRNFDQVVEAPT